MCPDYGVDIRISDGCPSVIALGCVVGTEATTDGFRVTGTRNVNSTNGRIYARLAERHYGGPG